AVVTGQQAAPRALSNRHRAKRFAFATERAFLDLAKFLPSPQRRPEDFASLSDSPDAETRARRGRTLDARTNRARERWPGGGLSGDAQLFNRPPRSRLFERTSELQEGGPGFRGIVCQRPGRFSDSAVHVTRLGYRDQFDLARRIRFTSGRSSVAS